MMLDWFRFLSRGNKNNRTYRQATPRSRARCRLGLERLEHRVCPSSTTYQIGTDTTIPAAGSPSFVKGQFVQFNITVSSSEANITSEGALEAAAVTSSVKGGFNAQVNVFHSETFDYVIKQNGETFDINTADGEETGTVTVIVNSPGLKFIQQPTTALARGILPQVQVQVVDSQGNPLGNFNGNVTLTLGNNFAGGKLNDGNPVVVQAQSGIATFSNLSIDTPGNNYTLVATLDDGAQVSSNYFSIGEKLVFTQQPTDGLPGKTITPTVAVEVENADGSPSSYTGSVTLSFANDTSSGTAHLSGNVATVQGGVASFPNLSIDSSGADYALNATTSDGSMIASDNFDIDHVLRFTQMPTSVGVSQAMTPPVVVTVYGPDGRTVDSDFNGTVTLGFVFDPSNGKANLSGNTATANQGVATFSNLKIDQAGEGYFLNASIADSAQVISNSFNVGLNLDFKKLPVDGVPGQPLSSTVTVAVDEPDGTLDTAYSGNITLAFGTDPTKGVAKLSGNIAPVLNGIATFPYLSIDTSGFNYTLIAKATGATEAASDSFDVAHVLSFTSQPAVGVVGVQLNPVKVSVFRSDGVTLDTLYNGQVNLVLGTDASSSKNAHLLGVVSVLAKNGVATFSTLSFDQPGNGYTLIASVPDGAKQTSSVFSINPNSATTATLKILANPASQTACVGQTVMFTAAASGFPVPTVQWEVSNDGGKSFSNIPGATTDTLTVKAISGQGTQSGQNGTEYLAAFTNGGNPVGNTRAAILTVQVPPTVAGNGNPQNATVSVGQKATFTTVETGGSPLPKVQWQVSTDNGLTFSNLTGGVTVTTTATTGGETSTLSFTASAGQNGNLYQAVFSNQGSAATAPASLTVQGGKPSVVAQPVGKPAVLGQSVTFTAAATGNPVPTVQWQVSTDGGKTFSTLSAGISTSTIANGVSSTLTLTATDEINGAEYAAVFSNTAGKATSKAATLTVFSAPVITSTGNPLSQTVTAGKTATFTAAAVGFPMPSVQWLMSGDGGHTFSEFTAGNASTKVVSGVETATLSFTAQSGQDGDEFLAVFFNSTNIVYTSPSASLTVQFGPLLSIQPASLGAAAGGKTTLTAAAIGEPAPTTVQWMMSNDKGKTWQKVSSDSPTAIPQGISDNLKLNNIQARQNGSEYEAVFTSSSGSVTTKPITLTVGNLAQVTPAGNPRSQSAAAGQKNVTFTASATTGNPAATVQWQASSDGGLTFVPFTGGTVVTKTSAGVVTSTLTLTAQAQQNGELFRAEFINVIGAVPTTAATLSVSSLPVVVDQPINQTVMNGYTATFTALAAGTPNPTVQWQISSDGGKTFSNMGSGTITDAFIGAAADTFTLNTTANDQGKKYEFRAVFTSTIGTTVNTLISNVVTLTVN